MKQCLLAVSILLTTVGCALADSATATQTFTVSCPGMAVVHLTSTGPTGLALAAPATGGAAPAAVSQSGGYLQWTSVQTSTTNSIKAHVSTGTGTQVPAGCQLQLAAGALTVDGSIVGQIPASSAGTPGTITALSATDQNLITTIPSVATGNGSYGSPLIYTLSVSNWASLKADTTESVTVTMTLSSN
jgi:hypothetical protein